MIISGNVAPTRAGTGMGGISAFADTGFACFCPVCPGQRHRLLTEFSAPNSPEQVCSGLNVRFC
jgi:hypothetical protein